MQVAPCELGVEALFTALRDPLSLANPSWRALGWSAGVPTLGQAGSFLGFTAYVDRVLIQVCCHTYLPKQLSGVPQGISGGIRSL